ncbi:hypothetical protein [Bosea lathyri]|uniref:hypothetical protein n=1 Tax=Bosea lathyri TaxID=1036778 RepID=UPI00135824FE|nr:hypothetical protein [Bosea lathyri]
MSRTLAGGVTEAFRAMVDHAVVRDAPDGKYEVDVVGPLSALTGKTLPDGGKRW